MRTELDRRAFTRGILAASLAGAVPLQSRASRGTAFKSSEAVIRSVRTSVERTIAAGGATGVAVAVIKHGRVIWTEGFGWADREAGVRATPRTPFSMASITKPFTTATLMSVFEEQRLSLDLPANDALRNTKLVGVNGEAATCSVRSLGAHVSGLPSMYESYDDSEAHLVRSPDSLLADYGKLAFPPASVYEYSNIGYAALHAIASSVTGLELGTLIHQRVLGPLGLHDSFFADYKGRVPSAALRYDSLGRRIPHYVTSTPASGELYASAYDLARFLVFNLRDSAGVSSRVLKDESLDEVHRTVFKGPSGIASTFGWFRGQTASGTVFFFKSGGDPGVANRICFAPSLGLGCAVITNQSNAAGLAYDICDRVMRSELPDWQRPEEYCGFPLVPLASAKPFLGDWLGSLENDGVRLPVRLNVGSPQKVSFSIGDQENLIVREIRSEGETMTGTFSGVLASPDAQRSGALRLQFKLMQHHGHLIGRVLALGGDPNFKNVELPYVLHLDRS